MKLIGTDNDLSIRPLPEADDRCFGVAFGNTALLRLLNHGISILGDGWPKSCISLYQLSDDLYAR